MAAAMVRQFRAVARQIGLIQAGQEPQHSAGETAKSGHICMAIASNLNIPDSDAPPNDLERTVTMASIIEKETAVPNERPLVASVYYNRLAKNIALDADPSVIYAELLAGAYTGALHHDDMHFNSPYNTYTHTGLPPAPSPIRARARWKPRCTQHNLTTIISLPTPQGHHRFARTIEEHNQNVAAYRRALREQ
jgi:UPF0755 protein